MKATFVPIPNGLVEHEGNGCCCYMCIVLSDGGVVKKCKAFPSQGGETCRKDEYEPVTKSCDEKSRCI